MAAKAYGNAGDYPFSNTAPLWKCSNAGFEYKSVDISCTLYIDQASPCKSGTFSPTGSAPAPLECEGKCPSYLPNSPPESNSISHCISLYNNIYAVSAASNRITAFNADAEQFELLGEGGTVSKPRDMTFISGNMALVSMRDKGSVNLTIPGWTNANTYATIGGLLGEILLFLIVRMTVFRKKNALDVMTRSKEMAAVTVKWSKYKFIESKALLTEIKDGGDLEAGGAEEIRSALVAEIGEAADASQFVSRREYEKVLLELQTVVPPNMSSYCEKSWTESHPDTEDAEDGQLFVDMFADPDPLHTFYYDFESLPTITLNCIHPSNGQTLDSTGLTIWRAAPLLSAYMSKNPSLVAGKSVLELGAGLGLCSITASKMSPKRVTCTDGDSNVLAAMRGNMEANKSPSDTAITTLQCIWGENLSSMGIPPQSVDVIIGADIIYVTEILHPLFTTVSHFLHPTGSFVLSYARRNVKIDYVLDMATAFGMSYATPDESEGCFIFKRKPSRPLMNPSLLPPSLPPPGAQPEHINFDDGHTPLLCKIRDFPTVLAPSPPHRPVNEPTFVSVHDDVAPPLLLDLIYMEATQHAAVSNAWGTYVTYEQCVELLEEVKEKGGTFEERAKGWREFWSEEFEGRVSPSSADREDYQRWLAQELLTHHLFSSDHAPPSSSPPSPASMFTAAPPSSKVTANPPRSTIHGFALWSLASVKSLPHGVSYHIDYAELIRFKTGIIHTPIYAGSVHCTRESETSGWKGGGYYANVGGLEHYEKVGYKGMKLDENRGTKGVLIDPTPKPDNGWVEIPYKYGRGIFHTGELPHQSGQVFYSDENNGGDRWGTTRVMVGINAFGHEIGPEVMRAPEHSPSFNRDVKLSQLVAKSEAREKKKGGVGGMGMEAIKGDPVVRKMLVLAKREKIKREMADERQKMEECIVNVVGSGVADVTDIIDKVVEATSCPGRDAAHVQVNLMVKSEVLELVEGGVDKHGMIMIEGCKVKAA